MISACNNNLSIFNKYKKQQIIITKLIRMGNSRENHDNKATILLRTFKLMGAFRDREIPQCVPEMNETMTAAYAETKNDSFTPK